MIDGGGGKKTNILIGYPKNIVVKKPWGCLFGKGGNLRGKKLKERNREKEGKRLEALSPTSSLTFF
jgi:hypothetical protein